MKSETKKLYLGIWFAVTFWIVFYLFKYTMLDIPLFFKILHLIFRTIIIEGVLFFVVIGMKWLSKKTWLISKSFWNWLQNDDRIEDELIYENRDTTADRSLEEINYIQGFITSSKKLNHNSFYFTKDFIYQETINYFRERGYNIEYEEDNFRWKISWEEYKRQSEEDIYDFMNNQKVLKINEDITKEQIGIINETIENSCKELGEANYTFHEFVTKDTLDYFTKLGYESIRVSEHTCKFVKKGVNYLDGMSYLLKTERDQVLELLHRIEKTKQNYNHQLLHTYPLREAVINELIRRGYEVKVTKHLYTIISWPEMRFNIIEDFGDDTEWILREDGCPVPKDVETSSYTKSELEEKRNQLVKEVYNKKILISRRDRKKLDLYNIALEHINSDR